MHEQTAVHDEARDLCVSATGAATAFDEAKRKVDDTPGSNPVRDRQTRESAEPLATLTAMVFPRNRRGSANPLVMDEPISISGIYMGRR